VGTQLSDKEQGADDQRGQHDDRYETYPGRVSRDVIVSIDRYSRFRQALRDPRLAIL
jgi:hypothetical protein